ncbi:MAG TPA: DEAD/DEAH box helicase [Desulfomicrobiaceae bacterium]|nr:DEAD/DEAH box helicase [Desulfomicrobiaceae bacterium]
MIEELPIHRHIPRLKEILAGGRCAVVQAPPGAGKTTRIPLALLDQPWLDNRKILLLEPRRLAARSCAAHMAALLNEPVGRTVGYQVSLDRRIGPETRIEVITEGIFTRKIQQNPFLEEVGLVVFDEFHERSIHSDLGLALALDSFESLCSELRLVVMSATMDTSAVSALMNGALVIESRGKSHPVTTVYLPDQNRQKTAVSVEKRCAGVIDRMKNLLEI